jgi:HEAT repeat protein
MEGFSVSTLLQFLQDTNSPLSSYAAGALGGMAENDVKLPETVLPALTNALHDARTQVRSYATTALGAFKVSAEPAVPALLDTWNDPEEDVRQAATNAFFALPAYAILRQADQLTRLPPGMNVEQQALYKRYWPDSSALIRLLDHPDLRVREMATNAFLRFKEAGGEVPTAQTLKR